MSDSLVDYLDKKSIAEVLEEIAGLFELKGENAFRVRAFRGAARAVTLFPGELRAALDDGSLGRARGIGPASLAIVSDLVKTGRSSMLEELQAQVPRGLMEMADGAGLGITRVRRVHEALGVGSLDELEAAARDGRLAALPRFGAKTAAAVMKAIEFARGTTGYRLLHHAIDEAEALRAALARLPGVREAIVAGDIRRRTEIVTETVVVLVSERLPADLFRGLDDLPGAREDVVGDATQVRLRYAGGGTARLAVAAPERAGVVLAEATGSISHLGELAAHATARGFSVDGGALRRGNEVLATADESALYRELGLAVIPPELREGRGEVTAAAANALPRLIVRADLRGFLHCHTKASDGSNTIEQLALACRDAGYEYIGITDHSQAAAYAGGMPVGRLLAQLDEIDELNGRLDGIRVLKGIEADILQDGRVDYDVSVLRQLDFVIGSVHGRFAMDQRAMTARMLAAMDNPYLTIIGHPTGRLLLSREPYGLDLGAVLARAAETGVALEINGDPHRLDLDWRRVIDARAAGIRIAIGADAHSLAGIANAEYGVAMARKGWLRAEDVLNCLSADDFLAFARRRRP